jgi:ParB/RepB/Spo0J family partition protein
MSRVTEIRLDEIRENPVALRAVNRESEQYVGLRDSIKSVGILNPVNVRERTEIAPGENGEDGVEVSYYELLDGLHRYSAARDIGIETMPIHILSLDDAQALEAQIMANVHKIETRPVEYTKQLFRILGGNPLLTLAELATKVAKSPTWISQRLSLLKLDPAIQKLADDGDITVTNAVQLAKLPPAEQVDYIDQAINMGAEDFVPLVLGRVKEIRDAVREGRKAEPSVFVANPKIRKMAVLSEEVDTSVIGPELCSRCNVADAAAGFDLGVKWALQIDPVSVEVRTSMDTERKAAQNEAKAKRSAEREKKKAAEAQIKADAAAKAAGM